MAPLMFVISPIVGRFLVLVSETRLLKSPGLIITEARIGLAALMILIASLLRGVEPSLDSAGKSL